MNIEHSSRSVDASARCAFPSTAASAVLLVLAAQGCGSSDSAGDSTQTSTPHSLFVAADGQIKSYEMEGTDERPGAIQDVDTPVDLYALPDGVLGVNLTTRNEVLFFDGRTMIEVNRIDSSRGDGTRPVHSFVSPSIQGRHYWLTLNDGEDSNVTTNTGVFIDLDPESSSYLAIVGEVRLGVGHHKAAFSATRERVVISNIGDCDNALSVYDFSDLDDIETVATLSGANAGFDADDPGEAGFDPMFCDPTYARGLPPAPHGCATSKLSEKVYCNLTSSGAMVVVDLDADEPSFRLLPTSGTGGGFTLAHPGGRYIYTMQETPREGDAGTACGIGQVVVTDATKDEVVAEVPLFYRGPDCEDELKGTAAESSNPGHGYFTPDGDHLYIPTSGGFGVDDAEVDQVLVLDTSNPARPEQLESLTVGVHTSHSSAALSGDARWLFVAGSVDGTVTKVDLNTGAVAERLDLGGKPVVLATFGSEEGPSQVTGPIE